LEELSLEFVVIARGSKVFDCVGKYYSKPLCVCQIRRVHEMRKKIVTDELS